MGTEYRFAFVPSSRCDVADVIRSLGYRVSVNDLDQLEIRGPDTALGGMPDALVSIEDPGLYFCNFGGCGEYIRRALLKRLAAECTYLVVTEL